MSKMTVTEALAEIKLVEKKRDHKKDVVMKNISTAAHLPDPLGDSKQVLKQELQAIGDLNQRIMDIRKAITQANIKTNILIGTQEMSVHKWLTWKREIADKQVEFTKQLVVNTKSAIDAPARAPQVWKDEKGEVHLVSLRVNLEYAELIKQQEALQEKLDKLDGQLSLKNATTVIEFKKKFPSMVK